MHASRQRSSLTILAVFSLVMSGCGQDKPTGAALSASTPAAAPAGDASYARCGLTSGAAPAAGVVPDGLLDGRMRTLSGEGSGAVVGVLLPLRDAVVALKANAERSGLTVTHSELETQDAEIFLSDEGGSIELRLEPAPSCADGTRVRLERSGG